jgi:cytoskeletal protein RodZ
MAMAPSETVATLSIPAVMQDTLIDQRLGSAVPNDGQAQSQNLMAPAEQLEKVIAAKAVLPTSSTATADPAAETKNVTVKMPAAAPAKPIEIAAAIVLPREPAAPLANVDSPVLSGDLAETQVITPASQNGETRVAGNSAIANLRDPAQEITIRAVAASWVEIVRDNGENVMAKLMQAGDSYVVEGNTRLYLSTGNAGGLQIVIGSDDPRPIGGTGQIVRDLPLVTDKLRQTL